MSGDFNIKQVLVPSKELDQFLDDGDKEEGLSKDLIKKICKKFELNTHDVLKYRDSM